MCVAVVVESKKRIPRKHLEAMHESNPDGAGLAWIDGNQIQYRKGLTWQQIDALQDKIPRPFFMHFRIATKGAKIPELTHPFPLGMQAFSDDLVGSAHAVLMHNGTWHDYRKWVPNGINEYLVSDTQVAAYACEENDEILDSIAWATATMHAKGDGKADMCLRGRWSEYEGNHYSNMYWKSSLDRPVYTGPTNWEEYYKRYPRAVPEPRKKGLSHQENHLPKKGKGRGKRKQRDTQPLGVPTPYEKAVTNYNRLSTDEKTNAQAWGGDKGEPVGWDGEPLDFTKKSVKCDDCGEEITQIPCACQELHEQCDLCMSVDTEHITGDHWACNSCDSSFYIPRTRADALVELEVLTEEQLDALDALEAEGHEALDMFEGNDSDLVLSGDRPEDWKKVDDYIRAQGIKI